MTEDIAEPVIEDLVEESVVAESVEESIEEEAAEAVAEELAPMLARTASDPAPMMSFDSTSVMPPLSLLPPLPGSRGRGRPPVPPAPNRRSVLRAVPRPSTSEATAAQAEAALPAVDDVWTPAVTPAQAAPVSRSLATVTRLPRGPAHGRPGAPRAPVRAR